MNPAPITSMADALGGRTEGAIMQDDPRAPWTLYQYGLPQGQVYPTGEYIQGGSHGSDVVFPLAFDEANNTNFQHTMCDVSSASID